MSSARSQPLPSQPEVLQSQPEASPAQLRLMQILVEAYPAFLAHHLDGEILWKDGTRMDFAAGTAPRAAPAALRSKSRLDEAIDPIDRAFPAPSLADMFRWAYPIAPSADAPLPSTASAAMADPGRIRVAAFFDKMYGDCRQGEVISNLVPVAWVPGKGGGSVRITRVNGVADRLAAVSAELDALPATFDKFLKPSAGTYNCRIIAGTQRSSAHGWGIAIDLAVTQADYWRWGKVARKPPPASARPAGAQPASAVGRVYRNRFPPEIVRVFEKHGFIWGGKWSHFDTMHFEYRPEILAASIGP